MRQLIFRQTFLALGVTAEKEKKDLEAVLRLITGVSRMQNDLQIAPRSSSSAINSTTSIQ